MFRIIRLSKYFTCRSVKIHSCRTTASDPILDKILLRPHLFALKSSFSSKPKDGEGKVGGKESIQTHPCSNPSQQEKSQPPNLKLKECKPVDINPTRPSTSHQTRIPSIQDCKSPDLMSQYPDRKCGWEEQDQHYRNKNKKLLLFGLLFTAVTLGTLWWIGLLEHKEKDKPVVKKQTTDQIKKVKKKRTVVKIPATSKDIPKEVPYLLIGGGTASFSAFRAIKSAEPTAKVLVVSNEPFYPYMRPPLSKEIWFNDDKESVKKFIFKQWNGSERSLFYEPDDFYLDCKDLMNSKNGGVSIARGWKITHLDVMEKMAYLDDGTAIHYDKCLLATGATPMLSPVFQVAVADEKVGEKVKVYRSIYDFEDTLERFEESKSIAIIGGGFLGSELACAMARKDKKQSKQIYQLFREPGNMGKILPEYLSFWTTEKVKAEGVLVMPQTEVLGVKSVAKGLELTLNNGKVITVDYAIVAVGVEPNTELAEKSDLEVDPELGGYLVNTELQARTDLYIAGDCACFYDPRLGRRRIEHHDHAVVTGRLAGENMTGSRKPYLHQSMFWSDLGPDVGYEAIGIVDSSLPTVAVFAKATDKDSPKAVVTATDEGIRSNIEQEQVPPECDKYLSDEQKAEMAETRKHSSAPNTAEGEDFGKGVIFYLRNDIVVGVVLWNVFNRMSVARQVLKDQRKYEDLNEVAKLFNIHED
ncbi:apoptosis inducing factor isoform X1 [Leptinotarsa decemlineata]|uniref:apoptosis inducing factor isoform X1 n=1 Tax=Leptinotarsa decemlineata TaxID=7539 RepID=UPI003D30A9F2